MERHEVLDRGRIDADDLVSCRLDLSGPLPRLDDFSGVIISGSPYNLMTADEAKTPAQVTTEEKLADLCDEILERDIPTLGLCYGLQVLALRAGGSLTRDHAERISAPILSVTEAGRDDPLLAGLWPTFRGYVGHAEAVGRIPESMSVLVTSETAPVQMGKFGTNVYGTQFHPEISREGARFRIGLYGGTYFDPHDYEDVLTECMSAYTEDSILRTFIELYRS
nr:gamma-glutamyl-gamma-aminobutyrate hydrolase family protein [Flaviflexus huanghaiensis]